MHRGNPHAAYGKSSTTGHRRSLLAALALIFLAALFVSWRIPNRSADAVLLSRELLLVFGLCAAFAALTAAWISPLNRNGWSAIAIGCALWSVAQALRGEMSLPAVTANTGLYLAATIALVAGCVLLAGLGRGPGGWRQLGADVIPPVVALVVLVWLTDIGPFLDSNNLPLHLEITAAVHGALAVGLIVVGLIGISSWQNLRVHPAVQSLMAAMALIACADGFWVQRWIDRNVGFGIAGDVMFCIGFLMVAVAALQTRLLLNWRPEPLAVTTPYVHRLTRRATPLSLATLLSLVVLQARFGDLARHGTLICAFAGLAVVLFDLMWQSLITERESVLAEEIGFLSERIDGLISQVGRDPLTGLLNRRAFSDRLEHEILIGRSHGSAVALALIDVDNFKAVNDTLGHAVGDQVLQAVASVLLGAARSSDVAARYAGDEFVMIFPGITEDGAGLVCHRMVESVRQINEQLGTIPGVRVTLSIGVAMSDKCKRSPAQMIAIADAAMYDAKEGGKDRVVVVNADTLTAAAYWGAEPTVAASAADQHQADRRGPAERLRSAS